MEQHRDEQIHCADCGASFVFSADEAAVFVERGLAPPKRCKDCRRARKERATQQGHKAPRRQAAAPDHDRGGSPAQAGPGGHGAWNGRGRSQAPRYGAPPRRYTGDVNEYRSPMQDSFSSSPFGASPRANSAWQVSGEYRSPMPDGLSRRGPQGNGGGRPLRPPQAAHEGSPKPQRRRPAEMFAITCNGCGVQAQVPFEPAEGREVFCPACYRARRTTA
jgi:CxxC-x17-CxxC domain-containing protein